ncbi:MAG: PEP-CTERM sorting domain-containing protein [Planctomycetota bacterium]
MTLRLSTFAFVAVAAASTTTPSFASVWSGSISNAWEDAGNWTGGVPVAASEPGVINLDGANVISSGATNSARGIDVGSTTGVATLNLTGGQLSSNAVVRVGYESGSAFSGVLNHTAGALRISVGTPGSGNRDLQIGIGGNGVLSGTYNFGGAQVDAPDFFLDSRRVTVAVRANQAGTINMTDYGTFFAREMVLSAVNGTSLLSITGGNLAIDIGVNGLSFNPNGLGSATLRAVIDDTGFSTIDVNGVASFIDGSGPGSIFDLQLGAGYVHTPGTVFEVINASGGFGGDGDFTNVSDGDVLDISGNLFAASYTTEVFSLTALPTVEIPEPGTALLSLIGGVLLISRRHRDMRQEPV